MKFTNLRSALSILAVSTVISLSMSTQASAYYYYVWRNTTIDDLTKYCANTSRKAMLDAGFANVKYDNFAASGERNGATINVNCIKNSNNKVEAILFSIGDDSTSVKNNFELLKKVLWGRVKFDDNP